MQDAYAQALLKLVEKGETPHAAVEKLTDNLKVNGRMALLPKIARAFERLGQKKLARTVMRLLVAHEHDARHAKQEAEAHLGSTEHMQTRVDSSLIGGWRVEAGEKLLDMSHKKQLLSIFNRATTH